MTINMLRRKSKWWLFSITRRSSRFAYSNAKVSSAAISPLRILFWTHCHTNLIKQNPLLLILPVECVEVKELSLVNAEFASLSAVNLTEDRNRGRKHRILREQRREDYKNKRCWRNIFCWAIRLWNFAKTPFTKTQENWQRFCHHDVE